jgi:diadenosine tetraphosphate (Ap4A) HIT family hydrolase
MRRCELCTSDGGRLIARAQRWRVVGVDDESFPAFYRVIWNAHVPEFTDLAPVERAECMDVVARVESVLRERLRPTKINLASLGNMVTHLHWHVIARFDWDSRFPHPVWAAAQRGVTPAALARLGLPLESLDEAVRDALAPHAS